MGGRLCMYSRVWKGMGPCRPDCCQDGWGRLGGGLGLWVKYHGPVDYIGFREGYG